MYAENPQNLGVIHRIAVDIPKILWITCIYFPYMLISGL